MKVMVASEVKVRAERLSVIGYRIKLHRLSCIFMTILTQRTGEKN